MGLAKKSVIELYPYQKKWLKDEARFKEGRWSRQSGKSFASAAGIVLDSRERDNNKWVTISSGERQVKEFMEKIKLHAKITEKAITFHEETYKYQHPDGYKDEYKIMECALKNGSKIIGIPANPDTARGYSANVYLDEFTALKNSREMWAAVFPIVSRSGFKLWVTYTPRGKQNKAYEISTNSIFTHHVVDIYKAVKEGCPQNIEELKAAIDDPELWAQEYEVQFLDEATAFITYDMLNEIESDTAGKPEFFANGRCYIGMDIGRRRDLTIMWVLEMVGDVLWAREIVEMQRASFSAQETELDRLYRKYRPQRVCIDQTGIGEKFVEDIKKKYGELNIEGVLFTSSAKLDLANTIKKKMEDKQIRIPIDRHIRDDIHSVKKITTSSGNIRFDAERTENSHADRFWSLALAIHAADTPVGIIEFQSTGVRRAYTQMAGYFN